MLGLHNDVFWGGSAPELLKTCLGPSWCCHQPLLGDWNQFWCFLPPLSIIPITHSQSWSLLVWSILTSRLIHLALLQPRALSGHMLGLPTAKCCHRPGWHTSTRVLSRPLVYNYALTPRLFPWILKILRDLMSARRRQRRAHTRRVLEACSDDEARTQVGWVWMGKAPGGHQSAFPHTVTPGEPPSRGTPRHRVGCLPEASHREHSPLSHAACSKALSPRCVCGYSNRALQTSFPQPGSHFDRSEAVWF